jgi:hypothetical protein
MEESQKIKQSIDGLNEFLKNFKKDVYTKTFLEILLEQLMKNKNEKKS